MKYNLREIMLRAWSIYRKNEGISFGECLHRAWLTAKAEEVNAKRIEDAMGKFTRLGSLAGRRFRNWQRYRSGASA